MKCLIKESKQLQGNSESREYRKFREIKKNEKLIEEIKLIKQYQMKYCNEEFLSHKKKKIESLNSRLYSSEKILCELESISEEMLAGKTEERMKTVSFWDSQYAKK